MLTVVLNCSSYLQLVTNLLAYDELVYECISNFCHKLLTRSGKTPKHWSKPAEALNLYYKFLIKRYSPVKRVYVKSVV